MAAIDKLYLNCYSDIYTVCKWIENKRPSLLQNMYELPKNSKELDDRKEEIYQKSKKINDRYYDKYEVAKGRDHAIKLLHDYYISIGSSENSIYPYEEIDYIINQHKKFEDKEMYKWLLDIPVANFLCKQDTWLKWHCPLECIREYLHNNCGVKEHWYYKLFFKY